MTPTPDLPQLVRNTRHHLDRAHSYARHLVVLLDADCSDDISHAASCLLSLILFHADAGRAAIAPVLDSVDDLPEPPREDDL